MESPPTVKRFNRWISNTTFTASSSKRRNTTKYLILFVTFLLSLIMSIHTQYMRTMISYTDESLLKRRSREIESEKEITPKKKQHFVLMYGTSTNSSGYSKVQSDFSSWTQQFQIYPWSWALPAIKPERYVKEQNFGPFMESLVHLSTAVPEAEYKFDRQKYAESKFFLTKFQDGFIQQWVQNRNILVGSDEFNIILDEKNGDDFFRALLKTLPWNDSRFSLLSEGILSGIVLHNSKHKSHIVDLWTNKKKDQDEDQGGKFLSWLLNDFNFDVIDSYGLAHKLSKRGIPVSIVNVDQVKSDLSHFISCNILEFSCKDGKVIALEESRFTEEKPTHDNSEHTDLYPSVLNEIEKVIRRYERQYHSCLDKNSNGLVNFYPQGADKQQQDKYNNNPCPDSNEAVKNEIRDILTSYPA